MCALYFKSSDCCSEAIFSRRGEKRKYELVYRYRELKKKKGKGRMMRCLWGMEPLSNKPAGNKQQSL